MYFKTIILTADIKNALGWSCQTTKDLKKIVQKEITNYCKIHKLKKKEIDYDVEYQAKITVKRKIIEYDQQIDLMKMLKHAHDKIGGTNANNNGND